MSMNYQDVSAYNAVTQRAQASAQAMYNQSLAQGNDAATALNAAKFEWQKKIEEAGQTGMWNGQYNMPSEQYFAGAFGTWMPAGPTAGMETLQKNQQDYQQAFNNSQLYGQYYAPGSTPGAGTATLGAQNQANQLGLAQAGLTGYYQAPGTTGQGVQTMQGQQQQFMQGLQTEQEARAAQNQSQTQTQAYLQLLSQLRGPADWQRYQNVLGATPNGMRDLYAAAMGQYVPGGGATTGVQPQAASLQSMMGDVSGQAYYGPGGGQLGQPNVYTGGQGSYGQGQAQTWGSGIGVGQQQATPQQQAQGMGGGTNLPAPNQISAQSWKNMAPSQQQMLLGAYENAGWDKTDVQALMNQALPKYSTNAATAGTFRLQ